MINLHDKKKAKGQLLSVLYKRDFPQDELYKNAVDVFMDNLDDNILLLEFQGKAADILLTRSRAIYEGKCYLVYFSIWVIRRGISWFADESTIEISNTVESWERQS